MATTPFDIANTPIGPGVAPNHAQDWKVPHPTDNIGDPPAFTPTWTVPGTSTVGPPVTVAPVNLETEARIAALEAEVADLKARERLFLDIIRELVSKK